MRCATTGLAAAGLVLAWQALVVHYRFGGQQSALFCAGDHHRVPSELAPSTYLWRDSSGYDGQFYRYVAHDPFLRRGFAAYADDARHRWSRLLIPLLAWALAAGRDQGIDLAYQLVEAAFVFLGVFYCARWMGVAALPEWQGGVLFLLCPATIASIDRMLLDGPLCALFAAFLWLASRDRWKGAAVIAAAAPLVRETGLLLWVAAVVAAVAGRKWKRLPWLVLAAVPFLAWSTWVYARTEPSSAYTIAGRFVWGLFARLFVLRDFPVGPLELWALRGIDAVAILGYLGSLTLAGLWLWQTRAEGLTERRVAIALFLLLGCALANPGHLAEAYGYSRPLAPLLLWLMLDAVATRQWPRLVPTLLVTAGVAIFLVSPALSIVRGMLR